MKLIHLLRLGFRYGGSASTITIFVAGFLIPVNDMRPYFGWLHYVSPIKYAFESVSLSQSCAFLAELLTHV
jgi:ABC-type multidrug transport system permease subunit